jgi:hypothetical protein
MATDTFKFTNSWREDMGKTANLGSDTFKLVLSNTAPTTATAVYADITEIANGYGYTTGGLTLAGVTYVQTAGVAKFNATDLVVTASGGSIGPFRYGAIIDDTVASPVKPVVGWVDYGSALTLATGDTLTFDFSASNGIYQVT